MGRLLLAAAAIVACAGESSVTQGPTGDSSSEGYGFVSSDVPGGDGSQGTGSPDADSPRAGEDAGTGGTGGTGDGPCIATCAGKHCGDDGCGGSCGLCPAGLSCESNLCVADCEPTCDCELPTNLSGWGAHVVKLAIPASAAGSGCDANSDGLVNDADGQVNSLLGIAAGLGFDGNQELADQIATGKLVLLLELAGYAGGDDSGFEANLVVGHSLGKQPDPQCNDFPPAGGCDWLVNPESYDPDTCTPYASLAGASVQGGQLEAGPSSMIIPISLGGATLNLSLTQAKLFGSVAGSFSLSGGHLCGQVPKSALETALDEACSDPEPPEVCASSALIAAALNCDLCSAVFELEAAEAKSLQVTPAP